MNLIFATHNQHKVDEISGLLPADWKVLTLAQAGITDEIPEPHNTLEENAREKARVIYELRQTACFSEDTGLEVASLNGEPGVRSARYAGEERSNERNMELLLRNLEGKKERSARFRTVICLLLDGKEYLFEGICPGRIMESPRGTKGFGYDPLFVPDGADRSFAEMSREEKSAYSHRAKAVEGLVIFLSNLRTNEQY